MPEASTVQLGAMGIILLFTIRELFAYLKLKKNGNGTYNDAILNELRTMNENHLHSIQKSLEQGNERLIDVIHADNTRMIEILGEIKGNLNSRK